jgi:hypothetical protein
MRLNPKITYRIFTAAAAATATAAYSFFRARYVEMEFNRLPPSRLGPDALSGLVVSSSIFTKTGEKAKGELSGCIGTLQKQP